MAFLQTGRFESEIADPLNWGILEAQKASGGHNQVLFAQLQDCLPGTLPSCAM
jgi:hypothetical protein